MKLTFFGGAGEVTGANHMVESANRQTKLLIDCGFIQSKGKQEENKKTFQYNPREIDALIVTHSHLDHIGRIPKLVKDGFRGEIFSTDATKELAEIMLHDALEVMKYRERKLNKNFSEANLLYSTEDIEKALSLWKSVEYYKEFIIKDFKITLKDAGHILGSCLVEIKNDDEKIVFTGDLGNSPNPILRDTDKIEDANVIIIESAYGDRQHEDRENRQEKIKKTIQDTISKQGVLMIPAFSLERTQEILFVINDLVENNKIPRVPIFLDSPLAIKATQIYRRYEKYYNSAAKNLIKKGDDLFDFPGLEITAGVSESKKINEVPSPKIIISGSGMSMGGRIIHHERRYLHNQNNTLLLVGYQAVGSLGRKLQDGIKSINIFGDDIPVRAKVVNVRGYSAHADTDGLLGFVEHSASSLKKVFVVQGEPKAALFLVQRIRDYLGINATAPNIGDEFEV